MKRMIANVPPPFLASLFALDLLQAGLSALPTNSLHTLGLGVGLHDKNVK